jgi:hypothetical protein
MVLADKFRLGSVLGDTFAVIRRNPMLCIGLALIIYALPRFGLSLWYWKTMTAVASGTPEFSAQRIAITVIELFGNIVLGAILQAALTRATIEDLNGKRPLFRDCIKTAFAVLLPTTAISLLVALGVWIGLLLLIVPGLFLLARWSVAIPALVQERLGVFAAMRRSRDLAKGSLWPLMAFWLVILVASIAIGLALDQFASLSDTKLGFFLNALADTASGIVQSIAPVAMYIELRRVKEGTSIDDLAEIFS